MATEEGEVTVRHTTTLPCGGTAIGPLITYPDPRATRLTIMVGARGVTVQPSAWHDAAMAFFINATLLPLALTGDSPLPADEDLSPTVATQGLLTVSAVGNPFVTARRDVVVGHDILWIGAAGRPVYSGGFGRYPVYLLTDAGIYALPQSASGVPGEARLIDTTVARAAVRPVTARQSLWLVDTAGRLLTLSGTTLTTILTDSDAVALAYDSRHDEVVTLSADGAVTAVQHSGRTYRRTVTLVALTDSGGLCLGVNAASRDVLDFGHEEAADVEVEYLSRPLVIDDWLHRRARHAEWCLFGEGVDARLTLRGERGHSCHGFVMTSLRLHGNVYAPVGTPIVAPPARTLRLHVSGTALSGALLMPVGLTTVSQ